MNGFGPEANQNIFAKGSFGKSEVICPSGSFCISHLNHSPFRVRCYAPSRNDEGYVGWVEPFAKPITRVQNDRCRFAQPILRAHTMSAFGGMRKSVAHREYFRFDPERTSDPINLRHSHSLRVAKC